MEYPVHIKNPKEINNEKGDYFLLIFREKETGKVQFVNLSVLYTYLIEQILEEKKSLNTILVDIIYLFGINDARLLQQKTIDFLKDLQDKGFVLGFKK